MLCPVCQEDEESVSHLFRDCKFFEHALHGIGIQVSLSRMHRSCTNWLENEIIPYSSEKLESRITTY